MSVRLLSIIGLFLFAASVHADYQPKNGDWVFILEASTYKLKTVKEITPTYYVVTVAVIENMVSKSQTEEKVLTVTPKTLEQKINLLEAQFAEMEKKGVKIPEDARKKAIESLKKEGEPAKGTKTELLLNGKKIDCEKFSQTKPGSPVIWISRDMPVDQTVKVAYQKDGKEKIEKVVLDWGTAQTKPNLEITKTIVPKGVDPKEDMKNTPTPKPIKTPDLPTPEPVKPMPKLTPKTNPVVTPVKPRGK